MKLYDAVWAPSPRRVRIFLAEKEIAIARVMIDMRADEHMSPAYLAINPRGTVPALALDDGLVLTETTAICRYIEALHPEPPLFGTTARDIAAIEQWAHCVESDGYAAVVNVLRNSAPGFAGRGVSGKWPPMPQIPELAERGRRMWDVFLDRLDERLGESGWIAGDAYSYADIVALVAVDFAKAARLPDAIVRPHIARWHAAATARPSAAA